MNQISINKAKTKDKMYMRVGVMKDYKLKLWKLRASHTLVARGTVGVTFDFYLFIFIVCEICCEIAQAERT
jgi:hypothetical protein